MKSHTRGLGGCFGAVHRAVLIAAGVVGALAAPAAGQAFTNVTESAGFNHVHTRPYTPGYNPTSIQEQSGAAAAGDFDGDGWPDLFITRFWDSDLLYRNNRDGTFTDVTASAFTGGIGVHETNGAAWGDVDNDGDLDLAVSTMYESRHLLYINDGAGQFSEEGQSRGVAMTGALTTTSGTGVAMGDYDRDGFLDMYVTEWRSFTEIATPAQSRLFRNLGGASAGHFVDVTAAAGVAMDKTSGPWANKSLAFTPRFSDLDRDGHTDLAVVSDGGTSRLFWNNGDDTFSDGTIAAGIYTGSNDMGFTLADFNGDGLLDWFASSIGDGTGQHPSGNRLYINNGDRTFSDATYAAGVREGGWGWGADAIDYNNNGLLDIAHVNGFSFAGAQQSVFFENIGSRTSPQYVNLATVRGFTDIAFGRALLTFDHDRDGDQDVFIVNFAGPPILYKNNVGSSAGDWLQIRTVGTESNRDGIGAYVTVTPDLAQPDATYVTEIDGSTNFLGQSEMVAHFGLGQTDVVGRIDVVWPSGYEQSFAGVGTNQRITIVEGLLADFNGDDVVDADDLTAWSENSGLATGAIPQQGDADRDGNVDGADYLLWQRSVGRSVQSGLFPASSAGAVPEPTSILLMGIGAAAIAAAGKRWAAR